MADQTEPSGSSNLTWIFDELPASGSITGGDPAAYIFKKGLDTFVREVLQNSHDQACGQGKPVHLDFTLYRLSGARRTSLLWGLNWHELRRHLVGVAESNSLVAGRLAAALAAIDGEEPLSVLTVEDSGTRGLVGEEDDHGNNFAALTRDVLVTTDNKAVRGGSHGLGKAVLWGFSSIGTVIFSSRLQGEGERFRLFGRTELPYHSTEDGSEWRGPGWFGEKKERLPGMERAVSAWDQSATDAAAPLLLQRGDQKGTGTSALIIGFTEPEQEQQRPPEDVAKGILQSSVRWFWPSLERKTLTVSARVFENDECLFEGNAELDEAVEPFRLASTVPTTNDRAAVPGEIAMRTLTVRVPAERPRPGHPAAPETEGTVVLKLLRASEDNADHPNANTVALVRGAGMVVKYWRPTSLALDTDGFFAVLLAGLATDEPSASSEAVETFLRGAEPPQHDDWMPATNYLASRYMPGSGVRLEELYTRIGRAVSEICRGEIPDDQPGPPELARLFPVGGRGGGKKGPSQFRVDFGSGVFDGEAWKVSAEVVRSVGGGEWNTDIALYLDGEGGAGDRLPITGLEIFDPAVTGEVKADGSAAFSAPSDVGRVRFHATAVMDGDSDVVARTRVKADVRPHLKAV